MRRLIPLLCAFSILLLGAGCADKADNIEKPVTFYYPVAEVAYDGESGIIGSETAESAGYEKDLTALLNAYLQGPVSDELRSPFPRHTSVINCSAPYATAFVELSAEFSSLSGIELTVACACIAKTVLGLVEAERVQISAADSLLDGQPSVVLGRSSILAVDTPEAAVDPTDHTGESQP